MPSYRESYAHLADGRPVYYFEEGAGPPFLYVHAGSGSADSAKVMFEVLRDRFHCIALDRIGYDRSGWLVDRPTTLEEQVEGIAAVHGSCTSDPAWVFGHSSGGNYAVAYAVAYPDGVRGLVLMEPALHSAFPPESRPPGVTTMIETVAPLVRAGQIHEGMAQFLGLLRPELSPEALDEAAANTLSSRYWKAVAMELPLAATWAPTPTEWPRLTQPSLVIEGDRTWGWLRAIAAKVTELLPGGELVTLEGLDHGAPGSAPGVVAQEAIEFIDRFAASEPEDS
jgi:pimeloyl-ACP methyl ester carboxylesterase